MTRLRHVQKTQLTLSVPSCLRNYLRASAEGVVPSVGLSVVFSAVVTAGLGVVGRVVALVCTESVV